MCLIIYRPSYCGIPEEHLWNGFINNSDGAGFMYSAGKGVFVRKGFWDFEKFLEALSDVPDNAELVIHFRLATHGVKDKRNCHPHKVNNWQWLAHNGIIHFKNPHDYYSDSACYAYYLRDRLKKKIDRTDLGVIEDEIGPNNKIVFLSRKGDVNIAWEDKGVWEKFCWYSNHSFEEDKWKIWREEDLKEYNEYCKDLEEKYYEDLFKIRI